MLILNYAHPFTPAMLKQIATHLNVGVTVLEERQIKTQIDRDLPMPLEVARLVEESGLSASDLQTMPFILNPPGLALAALCMIAEFHGRTGFFPSVLNIVPVANSTPPVFEVRGVLNLQSVREAAREKR